MIIGERFVSTVTFETAAGVLTDPTTVTVKIRAPSGTVTTYVYGSDAEVVKDSVGVYHVEYTVTAAAIWHVRWNGTGACVASSEVSFNIDASGFSSPL